MKKIILLIIIVCIIVGGWFLYTEVYVSKASSAANLNFTVKSDESVKTLSKRLEEEGVVRNAWIFRKFLVLKGVDKKISAGNYEVKAPITLNNVVDVLSGPSTEEKEITLIPGWTLKDFAAYLVEEEVISTEEELYDVTGKPALDYRPLSLIWPMDDFSKYEVVSTRPDHVSFEGYLAPDTYRIFSDSSVEQIVDKLISHRNTQFTDAMYIDINKKKRNTHQTMIIASLVEREVRGVEDRRIVADIFWRRFDLNWALQADSTVHYAVGKTGDLFTTSQDRKHDSFWNTYKYPGLPPSPICSPSLASIEAAIYPTANEYWYFLTDFDGNVHYAKTLEEHNANRVKYLSG